MHTFLLVLVSEADLQYFRTYFFHPSETDGSHDFFEFLFFGNLKSGGRGGAGVEVIRIS